MANNDLLIKVEANTKSASDGIAQLSSQFETLNKTISDSSDKLADVEKASGSLSNQALQMNAAIELAQKAFIALESIFTSTVGAFTAADDTLRGLSHTLEILGTGDVAGVTQKFEEFAQVLEAHSVVSENTSIKLLTMAKAIGQTDDQAEALVRTSVNLSAVTKQSVESTFDSLLQTFKGVTRGVSQYDSALLGLNASQLKHGEAVTLLDEKYAGFAEKLVNTYGGQAKVLENLTEHTLENVGALFAKFFQLDNRHLAIEALIEINDYIKSLQPTAAAMGKVFEDFFTHIRNGFDAIKDKLVALQTVLILLAPAMLVIFGPAALASIVSIGTAIAAAAAAMLPLIGEIALVSTASLAIAGTIEIITKNFESLGKVASDVLNAILTGVLSLGKALMEVLSPENLAAAFSGDRGVFDKASAEAKASFALAFDSIKKSAETNLKTIDLGFIGDAIKTSSNFISGFNKQLSTTASTTDQTADAAKKATAQFEGLSQAGQMAYDNLVKKVDELKAKNAELGLNVVTIADTNLKNEMKNLDLLAQELAAKDALTSKAKDLLAQARALTEENSKLDVYNKQKKALDEILQKNQDIQLTIDSANQTQAASIDLQLARQLELIEKKREELRLQGLLTDAANAGLNKQASLDKQGASVAKSNAPNPIAESMEIAGKQAGKGVTDAFAPLLGITSGVGAYVAAAQAVVDAVPQMLEAITHLIDSITELPMLILKDLNALFDSILKFIANIIPNIIHAVEGILKSLVSFLAKLPDVLISAIKQIPDLIIELLNELPDIIQNLITSLIAALPKILVSLVSFLLVSLPKIALKLAEFLAIELPIAIVNGLLGALKSIGQAIVAIFKGDFSFFSPKKIEDSIKTVVSKISASASKLFSIADLGKASQDAKSLTASVEAEVQKSVNYLKQAWLWVWNQIIMPLINGVKAIFQWVWDKILSPFFDFLKTVWGALINDLKAIWNNLVGILKATWDAIIGVLSAAWNGLIGILKAAWDGITSIFSGLWNGVKAIWNTLMDIFSGKINIFAGIMKIFSEIVDGLKVVWNAIIKTFAAVGSALEGIFKKAWDGLSSIFSAFADGAAKIGEAIWNGLKAVWTKGVDIFADAGKGIWDAVSKGFSSVANFFENIGSKIWNGLKNGLVTIGDVLKDSFEKLGSYIWEGLKNTIKGIGGAIASFFGFKSEGGYVGGASTIPGNSRQNDTVPTMLSPGEAIINRKLLENKDIKKVIDTIMASGGNFNFSEFLHMQAGAGGEVPKKYADGGFVGLAMGNIGSGGMLSSARGGNNTMNNTSNISLNLTIANNGAPIDATWVKTNVLPTIQSELKKASLKGDFIISQKGVRNA